MQHVRAHSHGCRQMIGTASNLWSPRSEPRTLESGPGAVAGYAAGGYAGGVAGSTVADALDYLLLGVGES